MSGIDISLSETDIRSPEASTLAVRADDSEQRDWARDEPTYPLLRQLHIAHLGVAKMPSPFVIVRNRLEGTYFLACRDGEGQVLIDGRWQTCSAGQAFLLPRGVRHAFQTTPGSVWRFCWVRYREPEGLRPFVESSAPVLARFDGESLERALRGLHRELKGEASPIAADLWARLIQHYVDQFVGPKRMDRRLAELWSLVETNLSGGWSSRRLADEVDLSEKQLERLCRRHLGRTPRQQLIWMRMRRAAELIAEGGRTIESIATIVGYQNPFVFSRTFKRCTGWPPSEYATMTASGSSTEPSVIIEQPN